MVMPTSGPLSFDNLRGEFGGGYPIYLSQYYAGAGLVRPQVTNMHGAAATVAPNPLYMSSFYGASNADWHTVYNGTMTVKSLVLYGYSRLGTNTGDIADNSANYSGYATIAGINWSNTNELRVQMYGNIGNGGAHAGGGWNWFSVNAQYHFERAAASFSYDSSQNVTNWAWSTTTNHFGGATTPIYFA
jgi:hypothetical protein